MNKNINNHLVIGSMQVIEYTLSNKKKYELCRIDHLGMDDNCNVKYITIVINMAKYSNAITDFINERQKYHDTYIQIYLLKEKKLIRYTNVFLLDDTINVDVIFYNESCEYSIVLHKKDILEKLQKKNMDQIILYI